MQSILYENLRVNKLNKLAFSLVEKNIVETNDDGIFKTVWCVLYFYSHSVRFTDL